MAATNQATNQATAPDGPDGIEVNFNVSGWPRPWRGMITSGLRDTEFCRFAEVFLAERFGLRGKNVVALWNLSGPTRGAYYPGDGFDPDESRAAEVLAAFEEATAAYRHQYLSRERTVRVHTWQEGGRGERDFEFTYAGPEHAHRSDDEIEADAADRAVRSRWGRAAVYYPSGDPASTSGGTVCRLCSDGSRSVIAGRAIVTTEVE